MAEILLDLNINASLKDVFKVISTSEGLDIWWSKSSKGTPDLNEEYKLDFGPGYQWTAVVTQFTQNKAFEIKLTEAAPDWLNSKIGFLLEEKKETTKIRFYHIGWPQINEHFRISTYCWAMYLRLLKRYIEFGEIVPYEKRLEV